MPRYVINFKIKDFYFKIKDFFSKNKMFKLCFRKKKNSINTHTILYEELSSLPSYLLFKAKIGKSYYTFNIIIFRRMCELAMENKKKITNPHDIYNRQIPKKIITKAKKFWKICMKKYSSNIIQKIIEYDYPITNLNWPKPLPPYPRGMKVMWFIVPEQNTLLSSFSIYYNNAPINGDYYYIPQYMENINYKQIDTASTTFVAIWYINNVWNKHKLVKRPFIMLDGKINILELFKPLTDPNYWKIKNNNYTKDTFELWFKFIENLKNE